MSGQDHHKKPYEDHTQVKLDLFSAYAKEWIPTFVSQHSELVIIDLFAGPGQDELGAEGSPILMCQAVMSNYRLLSDMRVRARLILNEKKKFKVAQLKARIDEYRSTHQSIDDVLKVEIFNEDSFILFDKLKALTNTRPTLLIADQNGVKFLESRFLHSLVSAQRVDVLVFTSTQHIRRFGKSGNLGASTNQLDLNQFAGVHNQQIHRELTQQLNRHLQDFKQSRFRLSPFSLRTKYGQVYGVIFGSHSLYGLDKFLKVAWTINPTNGDASWDIDNDSSKESTPRLELYPEHMTRMRFFEIDLERQLNNGHLKTNLDVYEYTLYSGFRPLHARKLLEKMKRNGAIEYLDSNSPKVTWDAFNKTDVVRIGVKSK